MTFTPEFMLELVIAIGSALGTYAAIRADLATLHERTKNMKDAVETAHSRIDEMQGFINERRRNHGN